tara:strand:+ start:110 stop:460 length:351 start_codon:yes stop_codon:yes gene_type:complete
MPGGKERLPSTGIFVQTANSSTEIQIRYDNGPILSNSISNYNDHIIHDGFLGTYFFNERKRNMAHIYDSEWRPYKLIRIRLSEPSNEFIPIKDFKLKTSEMKRMLLSFDKCERRSN